MTDESQPDADLGVRLLRSRAAYYLAGAAGAALLIFPFWMPWIEPKELLDKLVGNWFWAFTVESFLVTGICLTREGKQ